MLLLSSVCIRGGFIVLFFYLVLSSILSQRNKFYPFFAIFTIFFIFTAKTGKMKQELEWRVSLFSELSTEELYGILHLRCKIFILEQDAPYLDMDYKDQKAIHLHGYIGDKLIAYCRIFKSGDYFEDASIGRVIVAKEYRKYGYGHDLMKKAIELEKTEFGERKITLSAQQYLKNFYESHGFLQTSEMYLEDGLPHIQMKKND
jgi:ElaA protein